MAPLAFSRLRLSSRSSKTPAGGGGHRSSTPDCSDEARESPHNEKNRGETCTTTRSFLSESAQSIPTASTVLNTEEHRAAAALNPSSASRAGVPGQTTTWRDSNSTSTMPFPKRDILESLLLPDGAEGAIRPQSPHVAQCKPHSVKQPHQVESLCVEEEHEKQDKQHSDLINLPSKHHEEQANDSRSTREEEEHRGVCGGVVESLASERIRRTGFDIRSRRAAEVPRAASSSPSRRSRLKAAARALLSPQRSSPEQHQQPKQQQPQQHQKQEEKKVTCCNRAKSSLINQLMFRRKEKKHCDAAAGGDDCSRNASSDCCQRPKNAARYLRAAADEETASAAAKVEDANEEARGAAAPTSVRQKEAEVLSASMQKAAAPAAPAPQDESKGTVSSAARGKKSDCDTFFTSEKKREASEKPPTKKLSLQHQTDDTAVQTHPRLQAKRDHSDISAIKDSRVAVHYVAAYSPTAHSARARPATEHVAPSLSENVSSPASTVIHDLAARSVTNPGDRTPSAYLLGSSRVQKHSGEACGQHTGTAATSCGSAVSAPCRSSRDRGRADASDASVTARQGRCICSCTHQPSIVNSEFASHSFSPLLESVCHSSSNSNLINQGNGSRRVRSCCRSSPHSPSQDAKTEPFEEEHHQPNDRRYKCGNRNAEQKKGWLRGEPHQPQHRQDDLLLHPQQQQYAKAVPQQGQPPTEKEKEQRRLQRRLSSPVPEQQQRRTIAKEELLRGASHVNTVASPFSSPYASGRSNERECGSSSQSRRFRISDSIDAGICVDAAYSHAERKSGYLLRHSIVDLNTSTGTADAVFQTAVLPSVVDPFASGAAATVRAAPDDVLERFTASKKDGSTFDGSTGEVESRQQEGNEQTQTSNGPCCTYASAARTDESQISEHRAQELITPPVAANSPTAQGGAVDLLGRTVGEFAAAAVLSREEVDRAEGQQPPSDAAGQAFCKSAREGPPAARPRIQHNKTVSASGMCVFVRKIGCSIRASSDTRLLSCSRYMHDEDSCCTLFSGTEDDFQQHRFCWKDPGCLSCNPEYPTCPSSRTDTLRDRDWGSSNGSTTSISECSAKAGAEGCSTSENNNHSDASTRGSCRRGSGSSLGSDIGSLTSSVSTQRKKKPSEGFSSDLCKPVLASKEDSKTPTIDIGAAGRAFPLQSRLTSSDAGDQTINGDSDKSNDTSNDCHCRMQSPQSGNASYLVDELEDAHRCAAAIIGKKKLTRVNEKQWHLPSHKQQQMQSTSQQLPLRKQEVACLQQHEQQQQPQVHQPQQQKAQQRKRSREAAPVRSKPKASAPGSGFPVRPIASPRTRPRGILPTPGNRQQPLSEAAAGCSSISTLTAGKSCTLSVVARVFTDVAATVSASAAGHGGTATFGRGEKKTHADCCRDTHPAGKTAASSRAENRGLQDLRPAAEPAAPYAFPRNDTGGSPATAATSRVARAMCRRQLDQREQADGRSRISVYNMKEGPECRHPTRAVAARMEPSAGAAVAGAGENSCGASCVEVWQTSNSSQKEAEMAETSPTAAADCEAGESSSLSISLQDAHQAVAAGVSFEAASSVLQAKGSAATEDKTVAAYRKAAAAAACNEERPPALPKATEEPATCTGGRRGDKASALPSSHEMRKATADAKIAASAMRRPVADVHTQQRRQRSTPTYTCISSSQFEDYDRKQVAYIKSSYWISDQNKGSTAGETPTQNSAYFYSQEKTELRSFRSEDPKLQEGAGLEKKEKEISGEHWLGGKKQTGSCWLAADEREYDSIDTEKRGPAPRGFGGLFEKREKTGGKEGGLDFLDQLRSEERVSESSKASSCDASSIVVYETEDDEALGSSSGELESVRSRSNSSSISRGSSQCCSCKGTGRHHAQHNARYSRSYSDTGGSRILYTIGTQCCRNRNPAGAASSKELFDDAAWVAASSLVAADVPAEEKNLPACGTADGGKNNSGGKNTATEAAGADGSIIDSSSAVAHETARNNRESAATAAAAIAAEQEEEKAEQQRERCGIAEESSEASTTEAEVEEETEEREASRPEARQGIRRKKDSKNVSKGDSDNKSAEMCKADKVNNSINVSSAGGAGVALRGVKDSLCSKSIHQEAGDRIRDVLSTDRLSLEIAGQGSIRTAAVDAPARASSLPAVLAAEGNSSRRTWAVADTASSAAVPAFRKCPMSAATSSSAFCCSSSSSRIAALPRPAAPAHVAQSMFPEELAAATQEERAENCCLDNTSLAKEAFNSCLASPAAAAPSECAPHQAATAAEVLCASPLKREEEKEEARGIPEERCAYCGTLFPLNELADHLLAHALAQSSTPIRGLKSRATETSSEVPQGPARKQQQEQLQVHAWFVRCLQQHQPCICAPEQQPQQQCGLPRVKQHQQQALCTKAPAAATQQQICLDDVKQPHSLSRAFASPMTSSAVSEVAVRLHDAAAEMVELKLSQGCSTVGNEGAASSEKRTRSAQRLNSFENSSSSSSGSNEYKSDFPGGRLSPAAAPGDKKPADLAAATEAKTTAAHTEQQQQRVLQLINDVDSVSAGGVTDAEAEEKKEKEQKKMSDRARISAAETFRPSDVTDCSLRRRTVGREEAADEEDAKPETEEDWEAWLEVGIPGGIGCRYKAAASSKQVCSMQTRTEQRRAGDNTAEKRSAGVSKETGTGPALDAGARTIKAEEAISSQTASVIKNVNLESSFCSFLSVESRSPSCGSVPIQQSSSDCTNVKENSKPSNNVDDGSTGEAPLIKSTNTARQRKGSKKCYSRDSSRGSSTNKNRGTGALRRRSSRVRLQRIDNNSSSSISESDTHHTSGSRQNSTSRNDSSSRHSSESRHSSGGRYSSRGSNGGRRESRSDIRIREQPAKEICSQQVPCLGAEMNEWHYLQSEPGSRFLLRERSRSADETLIRDQRTGGGGDNMKRDFQRRRSRYGSSSQVCTSAAASLATSAVLMVQGSCSEACCCGMHANCNSGDADSDADSHSYLHGCRRAAIAASSCCSRADSVITASEDHRVPQCNSMRKQGSSGSSRSCSTDSSDLLRNIREKGLPDGSKYTAHFHMSRVEDSTQTASDIVDTCKTKVKLKRSLHKEIESSTGLCDSGNKADSGESECTSDRNDMENNRRDVNNCSTHNSSGERSNSGSRSAQQQERSSSGLESNQERFSDNRGDDHGTDTSVDWQQQQQEGRRAAGDETVFMADKELAGERGDTTAKTPSDLSVIQELFDAGASRQQQPLKGQSSTQKKQDTLPQQATRQQQAAEQLLDSEETEEGRLCVIPESVRRRGSTESVVNSCVESSGSSSSTESRKSSCPQGSCILLSDAEEPCSASPTTKKTLNSSPREFLSPALSRSYLAKDVVTVAAVSVSQQPGTEGDPEPSAATTLSADVDDKSVITPHRCVGGEVAGAFFDSSAGAAATDFTATSHPVAAGDCATGPAAAATAAKGGCGETSFATAVKAVAIRRGQREGTTAASRQTQTVRSRVGEQPKLPPLRRRRLIETATASQKQSARETEQHAAADQYRVESLDQQETDIAEEQDAPAAFLQQHAGAGLQCSSANEAKRSDSQATVEKSVSPGNAATPSSCSSIDPVNKKAHRHVRLLPCLAGAAANRAAAAESSSHNTSGTVREKRAPGKNVKAIATRGATSTRRVAAAQKTKASRTSDSSPLSETSALSTSSRLSSSSCSQQHIRQQHHDRRDSADMTRRVRGATAVPEETSRKQQIQEAQSRTVKALADAPGRSEAYSGSTRLVSDAFGKNGGGASTARYHRFHLHLDAVNVGSARAAAGFVANSAASIRGVPPAAATARQQYLPPSSRLTSQGLRRCSTSFFTRQQQLQQEQRRAKCAAAALARAARAAAEATVAAGDDPHRESPAVVVSVESTAQRPTVGAADYATGGPTTVAPWRRATRNCGDPEILPPGRAEVIDLTTEGPAKHAEGQDAITIVAEASAKETIAHEDGIAVDACETQLEEGETAGDGDETLVSGAEVATEGHGATVRVDASHGTEECHLPHEFHDVFEAESVTASQAITRRGRVGMQLQPEGGIGEQQQQQQHDDEHRGRDTDDCHDLQHERLSAGEIEAVNGLDVTQDAYEPEPAIVKQHAQQAEDTECLKGATSVMSSRSNSSNNAGPSVGGAQAVATTSASGVEDAEETGDVTYSTAEAEKTTRRISCRRPEDLEEESKARSAGSSGARIFSVPPLPLASLNADCPASSATSSSRVSRASLSSHSRAAGEREQSTAAREQDTTATPAESKYTDETKNTIMYSEEEASTVVSSSGSNSTRTATALPSPPSSAASQTSTRFTRPRIYRYVSSPSSQSNLISSSLSSDISTANRTSGSGGGLPTGPTGSSSGAARPHSGRSCSKVGAATGGSFNTSQQRSIAGTDTASSVIPGSARRSPQQTDRCVEESSAEATVATAARWGAALTARETGTSSANSAIASLPLSTSRQSSRGSAEPNATHRSSASSAQSSSSSRNSGTTRTSTASKSSGTSGSSATSRSSSSAAGEDVAPSTRRREGGTVSAAPQRARRVGAPSESQDLQHRRGREERTRVPPLQERTTRHTTSTASIGLPPSPSAARNSSSSHNNGTSSSTRTYAGLTASVRCAGGDYTSSSNSGWVPTWGQTLIDLGLVRPPGQHSAAIGGATVREAAVTAAGEVTRRGCLLGQRPPTMSDATVSDGGGVAANLAGASASPASSRLAQHVNPVEADASVSWCTREDLRIPMTPSTTIEPPSPQHAPFSSVGSGLSYSQEGPTYSSRRPVYSSSSSVSSASSSSSSPSPYLDRSVRQCRYAAPTEASEARRQAISAYQLHNSLWLRETSSSSVQRRRAAAAEAAFSTSDSPLLLRSASPAPVPPLILDYVGSASSSSSSSSRTGATSPVTVRRSIASAAAAAWPVQSQATQQQGYQRQHSSLEYYYAASGGSRSARLATGYSPTLLTQQQMRRQTVNATHPSSFATNTRAVAGSQTAGRESPEPVVSGGSAINPSHLGVAATPGRASLPPSPLTYTSAREANSHGRAVAACLVDTSIGNSSSSRSHYAVPAPSLPCGLYSSGTVLYHQQQTQTPQRRYSASHPLGSARSSSSSISISSSSSTSTATSNIARAQTACLPRGPRRSVGGVLHQHPHTYDRSSVGGRIYLERSDGIPWAQVTRVSTTHYPGRFSFREESVPRGVDGYHQQIQQEEERRREDMLQVLFDLLPTSQFNSRRSATLSEEAKKCSICFEDYEHDDEQRRLPCTHVFHKNCIDIWLRRSLVCPMCKHDLRSSF